MQAHEPEEPHHKRRQALGAAAGAVALLLVTGAVVAALGHEGQSQRAGQARSRDPATSAADPVRSPAPGTGRRSGESLVARVVGSPRALPVRAMMKLRYGSDGDSLSLQQVRDDPTISVAVGEHLWVTGEGPQGRRVDIAPQDGLLRADFVNGLNARLRADHPGVTRLTVTMPGCAPPPSDHEGRLCTGGIRLIGEVTVMVRE